MQKILLKLFSKNINKTKDLSSEENATLNTGDI